MKAASTAKQTALFMGNVSSPGSIAAPKGRGGNVIEGSTRIFVSDPSAEGGQMVTETGGLDRDRLRLFFDLSWLYQRIQRSYADLSPIGHVRAVEMGIAGGLQRGWHVESASARLLPPADLQMIAGALEVVERHLSVYLSRHQGDFEASSEERVRVCRVFKELGQRDQISDEVLLAEYLRGESEERSQVVMAAFEWPMEEVLRFSIDHRIASLAPGLVEVLTERPDRQRIDEGDADSYLLTGIREIFSRSHLGPRLISFLEDLGVEGIPLVRILARQYLEDSGGGNEPLFFPTVIAGAMDRIGLRGEAVAFLKACLIPAEALAKTALVDSDGEGDFEAGVLPPEVLKSGDWGFNLQIASALLELGDREAASQIFRDAVANKGFSWGNRSERLYFISDGEEERRQANELLDWAISIFPAEGRFTSLDPSGGGMMAFLILEGASHSYFPEDRAKVRSLCELLLENKKIRMTSEDWAKIAVIYVKASLDEEREAVMDRLERIGNELVRKGRLMTLSTVLEAVEDRGLFQGWPRAVGFIQSILRSESPAARLSGTRLAVSLMRKQASGGGHSYDLLRSLTNRVLKALLGLREYQLGQGDVSLADLERRLPEDAYAIRAEARSLLGLLDPEWSRDLTREVQDRLTPQGA